MGNPITFTVSLSRQKSKIGLIREAQQATHSITSSARASGAVAHRDHRFGGFELVHALLAIAHAHTLLGTACISSASAALKLRSPGAAPL